MGVPQRSLPMDPSSLYGQGIIQPKPGLSGAGEPFPLFVASSTLWYTGTLFRTPGLYRCSHKWWNKWRVGHQHGPPNVALSTSFCPPNQQSTCLLNHAPLAILPFLYPFFWLLLCFISSLPQLPWELGLKVFAVVLSTFNSLDCDIPL
jgi:hypothetical protein